MAGALEDTAECVQDLCRRANLDVGCNLRYDGIHADGRFKVAAGHDILLLGSAFQLFGLIHAFECGYVAARQDAAPLSTGN